MKWDTQDLICALASAPGGAPRGIVRLSGPQTVSVLAKLFHPADPDGQLDTLRQPTSCNGWFALSSIRRELPTTLYVWPGVRSYTRQPMAEVHTLGSPPLLQALLEELLTQGARPALPGEFTLRAFLGGRIDLAQAEAVLGVVDARGEPELRTALDQLAGGLGARIEPLREQLLNLCADLEAGLDFADEDITFLEHGALMEQLQGVHDRLEEFIRQLQSRTADRPVYRAVLFGWPNTGKSSLFNALVGQPAALVSATAGTTRDYLTAPLEISGLRFELIDTAGIAITQEGPTCAASARSRVGSTRTFPPADSSTLGPALAEIESQAQLHAHDQAQHADLVLFCVESSRPLNPWEQEVLARPVRNRIVVLTKGDVLGEGALPPLSEHNAVLTSAHTGRGLSALKAHLAALVGAGEGADPANEAETKDRTWMMVPATAARCHQSLMLAQAAIERALEAAHSPSSDELITLEVRLALEALGQITGAVYTEDILDRIFSRFCIGK